MIFKDDPKELRTYHSCSYGYIQKLLNFNEAAVDPTNDLLPSLGQDMGEYNVLTSSIANQSQLDMKGTPSASVLSAASQSKDRLFDMPNDDQFRSRSDIRRTNQSTTSNQALIKNAKELKYNVSNPGFFATFKN